MASEKNYYEILEVTEDASPDEITKQYRKFALKWHPDKNKDKEQEAQQKFQEIQEAYGVLKDPDSRRDYDWKLRRSRRKSTSGTALNTSDTFNFFTSSPFDSMQRPATGPGVRYSSNRKSRSIKRSASGTELIVETTETSDGKVTRKVIRNGEVIEESTTTRDPQGEKPTVH